jgi:hypothetical protein
MPFLRASLRQTMIRKLANVGKDKDGWKKADEHLTTLMDQEHMITLEDTEAAIKRCEQHLVVVTGPFIKKFPCNHIINIKKKFSFSGEAKDSVIFSFFILLHKRAKPAPPPYLLPPPTYPPIP